MEQPELRVFLTLSMVGRLVFGMNCTTLWSFFRNTSSDIWDDLHQQFDGGRRSSLGVLYGRKKQRYTSAVFLLREQLGILSVGYHA